MSRCRRRADARTVSVPLLTALGVSLTVLLAACGSSPTPVPAGTPTTLTTTQASGVTFTMNGAFDLLVSSDSLPNGALCAGTGSMDDIATHTGVYVYDGNRKLLATGNLGRGTAVQLGGGGACKFALTVNNVPDGLATYYVEVGTHGEQPVSSATAHGWVFLSVSDF